MLSDKSKCCAAAVRTTSSAGTNRKSVSRGVPAGLAIFKKDDMASADEDAGQLVQAMPVGFAEVFPVIGHTRRAEAEPFGRGDTARHDPCASVEHVAA